MTSFSSFSTVRWAMGCPAMLTVSRTVVMRVCGTGVLVGAGLAGAVLVGVGVFPGGGVWVAVAVWVGVAVPWPPPLIPTSGVVAPSTPKRS